MTVPWKPGHHVRAQARQVSHVCALIRDYGAGSVALLREGPDRKRSVPVTMQVSSPCGRRANSPALGFMYVLHSLPVNTDS